MAPLLNVQSVSVEFDGFTVLDNFDMAVEPGELRFLIGPNGAGKTTLLDVITGRVRPRGGHIVFDDVDVGRWPEHRRARRGIGRKFQTPSVFPSLTTYENLEVALGSTRGTRGLIGRLEYADRSRIQRVLEIVGLTERSDARAGGLAHGEMQWLEIAMLLVQDRQLLLLDEPIAGMTQPERERTGALLEQLTGQHTLIVVEHDMQFMRQFARKVTVMHMGKVLVEGSVETVQDDTRVQEIYLGPRRARGAA
jgi:urea transport system ATP-binding protein